MFEIHQIIPALNRKTGGTAYSCSRLLSELALLHARTYAWSLNYPEHGQLMPVLPAQLKIFPVSMLARHFRGLSLKLWKELSAYQTQGPGVVHSQGVWMFPNLFARHFATRHKLALVISPRGMLEPWSLAWRSLKKAVAWQLYEKQNFQAAQMLHATSQQELESIRALGLRQAVAVIPNGIDLPDATVQPDLFLRKFPQVQNKKILLFLSRLHPKKGLELLLRAWQDLQPEFREWHLIIAGASSNSYDQTLQSIINQQGLNEVSLVGDLEGTLKSSAFAASRLFVLPSFSENFGVVVGEALAHGVPVVTTDQTPWAQVETLRLGKIVKAESFSLQDGLREMFLAPDQFYVQVRATGPEYIKTNFSWPVIAQQMSACYAWLLGQGSRPDCVDPGTLGQSFK